MDANANSLSNGVAAGQNGFGSFHEIVMRSHNNTNIKVANDTSLAFGITLETNLQSIFHQSSKGKVQQ
jgi:hypothetical protein